VVWKPVGTGKVIVERRSEQVLIDHERVEIFVEQLGRHIALHAPIFLEAEVGGIGAERPQFRIAAVAADVVHVDAADGDDIAAVTERGPHIVEAWSHDLARESEPDDEVGREAQ